MSTGWRRSAYPAYAGVLLHYVVLLGLVALLLWLVVPRAVTQVQQAIGSVPTTSAQLKQSAKHRRGIKHTILVGIQKRLKKLPSGTSLVHPALTVTKTAFEVLVGIFFVFAVAAYWIFERDRAIGARAVAGAAQARRVTRDTWVLIDQKLGAFVRGELILIVFVAVLLSAAFCAIGLHYWLLIGTFAGHRRDRPRDRAARRGRARRRRRPHPELAHGALRRADRARGATARGLRRRPAVLGHASGLSPLVVLISVRPSGSCSAASTCCWRSRSPPCWRRSSTSCSATSTPPTRTCPRCSSRRKEEAG